MYPTKSRSEVVAFRYPFKISIRGEKWRLLRRKVQLAPGLYEVEYRRKIFPFGRFRWERMECQLHIPKGILSPNSAVVRVSERELARIVQADQTDGASTARSGV